MPVPILFTMTTNRNLETFLQHTDITNECQYKVHSRYNGGLFYTIEAECISTWKMVAMFSEGQLTLNTDKIFKVKYQNNEIKVYRNGKMPY